MLIKEYRDLTETDVMSVETIQQTGLNRFGSLLRLSHISEGWIIAGSCLRWQNERYSVHFINKEGVRHGKQFLTLVEAEIDFVRKSAK